MTSARTFALGLAHEEQSGFSQELTIAAAATAAELGWTHRQVDTEADEVQVDTLLAIGNVRLFPDLLNRKATARRVLWHGETLPRHTPESGGPVHTLMPTGRMLDLLFKVVPAAQRVEILARWREQAAIVREPLGNLRLLREHASRFDRIVIDALDRAEGAREAGIKVDVISYGYHESYAGPLRSGGERPIQALLLAHLVGRHGRRQRLLATFSEQLRQRGIELVARTGWTSGAERSELLSKTRVVVDIHRVPGNSPGFRFVVAAAAGAALVSEPLAIAAPLVPGVHYVEAEADRMTDAVAALLSDEPARARLVEAGQDELRDAWHMRSLLPKVIGGAEG